MEALLTLNIAAAFRPRFGGCIKNIRKVLNLAALFALHLPFLPQKSAAPVEYQQILDKRSREAGNHAFFIFETLQATSLRFSCSVAALC